MNWEVQTLPDLTQFQMYAIKKKKVKNWNNNVLETRAEFFLAAIKALVGEGGGGILLGDNTGGGADMLRPIRLRCAGIWIPTEFRCLLI